MERAGSLRENRHLEEIGDSSRVLGQVLGHGVMNKKRKDLSKRIEVER